MIVSPTPAGRTTMQVAAHLSLVSIYIVGFGTFIIPGWLPPPSPSLAGQDIVTMLAARSLTIRIGLVLSLMASPLLLGLPAVIAAIMRRLEGDYPVLAPIQLLCGFFACILTGLPSLFWIAVSWRGAIAPDVVQVFDDLGWFLVISYIPTLIVQFVAIGACLQMHDKHNIYPRWVPYLNYWIAILSIPSAATFFFKSGPLAWNGMIGFWIPVGAYFIWWLTMYFTTLRALKRVAGST